MSLIFSLFCCVSFRFISANVYSNTPFVIRIFSNRFLIIRIQLLLFEYFPADTCLFEYNFCCSNIFRQICFFYKNLIFSFILFLTFIRIP
ncbi:hypothetical protein GIB67_030518, partial [Kingdonia uniflora]